MSRTIFRKHIKAYCPECYEQTTIPEKVKFEFLGVEEGKYYYKCPEEHVIETWELFKFQTKLENIVKE